jgi:hypothetical protein
MKKILSIFSVLFCLTACGKSYPQMDYQEILDKEGLCNEFEGIEAIIVREDCEKGESKGESKGVFSFNTKDVCKIVIDTTICKDGTKIIK